MMTLRARLVLWLLLMSVVPLGAVTFYSYVNSAQALREAAGREADLLAGELTSRMQLVTAELSTRGDRRRHLDGRSHRVGPPFVGNVGIWQSGHV